MAISPLVRITKSQFFLPDTIAICTDGDQFTIVHEGFDKAATPGWNNGIHPVTGDRCPGALDSKTKSVPLPKPLLTGDDRKPNDFGWCVGDLAVTEGSGTFTDGSIVQLFHDDGTKRPLWALVTGGSSYRLADGQPGAYTHYSSAKRITPVFDQPKEVADMSSTYTPQRGDFVEVNKLTREQLTEFAKAMISAGADDLEWRSYSHSANAFEYFGWHLNNGTYFADCTSNYSTNVTDRFLQGAERMPSSSFPKGTFVDCRQLTDEQIEAFVDACRPHVREVESNYMEYVRGSYPYLAIARDNNLWTSFGKYSFMTNNVTDQYKGDSPMSGTRNPFKRGDLVVPNGFKYFGDRMRHGSNPTMAEWEANQTVLKVTDASSSSLCAGTDHTYSYHYSEVRMATDKEIEAAQRSEKPSIELKNGSLIKLQGTVYMVTRALLDSEYRVRTISVDSGTVKYITVRGPNAETFTVLGQIMEDGDYRPTEMRPAEASTAAASAPSASDPRTWKKGQRVRCVTDQRDYVTKGNVYTLIEDASTDSHGVTRIKIRDNVGDRATYHVTDESPNFVAV